MVVETGTLQMVRISLDVRRLLSAARLERLPLREVDLGYLVHCELAALFGERLPKPFAVREMRGPWVEVLGYGDASAEELLELARIRERERTRSRSWRTLGVKAMPSSWPPGHLLRFEARVCPVVRMDKESCQHRKGAEVDAFLARCWAVGPEVRVEREAVYREWLGRHVESNGAARVRRARVVSFSRSRLLRRTQGATRKARGCERPDVLLEGTLQIESPVAFDALLRRGLGRHRAFGFGMLLLRRVEVLPC